MPMTNQLLDQLEKQFGPATLWGWVREYLDLENECEADEHIKLEEFLYLRCENAEDAEHY